jgi:ketosteroid isomerase-like protein
VTNFIFGNLKQNTIMKNKIFLGGFLAVILTLSIACNQKKEKTTTAAPAINADQIKTEIQAIENRFAEAFNTKNADSLTYYADDAISFFNEQMPIVGKAAIQKFIMGELMRFPKGAKISFETKEVHISIDANQVVEIGRFETIDSTNTKINVGNYISLFEKRNGKYVCLRDMSSDEPFVP